MDFYKPALQLAGLSPATLDYVTGTGDAGPLSDLCGVGVCWVFYTVGIHFLYYAGSAAWCAYMRKYHKLHPVNTVSDKLKREQMLTSEIAFPLYSMVGTLGDLLRKKGLAQVSYTVAGCGGWLPMIISSLLYFFAVETLVFWDHYYLLHVTKWGKKHMKHNVHHAFKHEDQLSAWSAFAFEAVDGASQGLPMVLCICLFPIHVYFYYFFLFFTAFWTLYIHACTVPLPWPFMGADYHFLHHKFNWYNFGFYTLFWDSICKTVKHPHEFHSRWKAGTSSSKTARLD